MRHTRCTLMTNRSIAIERWSLVMYARGRWGWIGWSIYIYNKWGYGAKSKVNQNYSGLCDIWGGGNWNFFFFFFLFSIFRLIYFSRKTRLDDESDGCDGLCTRGGGRWRARNMRHSNRWNALGLHFPRVWQWQPVESSRNARVPRPRLSSKTNFLARTRVSTREFNVFCLRNFDCD